MEVGHKLNSGYAMTANTVGVKRNFSISIYIEATGGMAESGLRHMTGNHERIKPPRVQISFPPPILKMRLQLAMEVRFLRKVERKSGHDSIGSCQHYEFYVARTNIIP